MIDTVWFLDRLQGDGLIVRMHVDIGRPAPSTVVRAFSYWVDDMAYNGFQSIYRHDESSARGVLPLEWELFPAAPGVWEQYVASEAARWPKYWHESTEIICTMGTSKRRARKLPTGHPLVLTHLARFQAAATLTHPEGIGWPVSADIVSKRLEGILRANLKEWRRLMG